jgi:transposase
MVTDQQVRRLRMLIKKEKTRAIAASKAGMDEKTARKYLGNGKLPGESKRERSWQTRQDPFSEEWERIRQMLEINTGLEAKTIFEDLQREKPGEFSDGQLRTLQRRIKVWRATEGAAKEVFFEQEHHPGRLGASDYTDMAQLGITIAGGRFEHLVYHFVLTYSNWETGYVCFSESFESLSEGLQNALWELGGVPERHRTDRLSAAVNKDCNGEEFTQRYQGLLRHYGLVAEKTQAGKGNENGDIEQRHYRLKRALDQNLLMRGSRDFSDRREYENFLKKTFTQLNAGRVKRFEEEIEVLKPLPAIRLNDYAREDVKVSRSSTVHVRHNTYSVDSRLIGEWVRAYIYAEKIQIWYSQRLIETIPRLRGENKHRIQYRHIIDWLVRKPGAFENYRFRSDLFPSSHFRMAYDELREHSPTRASKEYLKILHLAAKEGEEHIESALMYLLGQEEKLNAEAVERIVKSGQQTSSPSPTEVVVDEVDLTVYDELLSAAREEELVYA